MKTHEIPASPGSYADFVNAHPELDQEQVQSVYYGSLDVYRGQLAEFYGISREELHDMSFRKLGSIPTQALQEA